MTATVISHPRPRRKRGSAWGSALRRLGALVLTVAVLGAVAVFTPHAPAPQPRVAAPTPTIEAAASVVDEVDVALDLAGAPLPVQRSRRVRSGVPLNAAAVAVADGYEILSAAELDAISQARD